MHVSIMLFWMLLLSLPIAAETSITAGNDSYRDICKKASTNEYYFRTFRSMPAYINAVEITDGEAFADYIRTKASKETKKNLSAFRLLDTIGLVSKTNFPELGEFSATTLRYIVLADHMSKVLHIPVNATIVEIGAGFGGQCYVLSDAQPFRQYYIYDIPEAAGLIGRVMEELAVSDVVLVPFKDPLPENKIDLFISNYAYSECSREMQLDYFDRVIKKADRGYVIYNQIAKRVFGMDSLTPDEFVALLKGSGKHPQVLSEPLQTAEDNVLIIWDL